jgi:hypothetical protein
MRDFALASPEDRAAFESVGLGYTETFGAPALRNWFEFKHH